MTDTAAEIRAAVKQRFGAVAVSPGQEKNFSTTRLWVPCPVSRLPALAG
jgi:hypothetical protein